MENRLFAKANLWYNMFIFREPKARYGYGSKGRMNPTNDFVFKKLFGEERSAAHLLSLLNALLEQPLNIRPQDLAINHSLELTKKLLEAKACRLDIFATTLDKQFNVEMQNRDERNMDRRLLFYSSALITKALKAGEDYAKLKRTMMVCFVNFACLPGESFHHSFHLRSSQDQRVKLTDALEFHVIELPKFRRVTYNKRNALHRWLLFMDPNVTKEQLEEMIAMDATIGSAEEQLQQLSRDEEAQALYEFYEHARINWNSWLSSAKEEGLEQGIERGIERGIEQGIERGIERGKRLVVGGMLQKGLEISLIAEIADLTEEEIRSIARHGGEISG